MCATIKRAFLTKENKNEEGFNNRGDDNLLLKFLINIHRSYK